MRITPLDIQQKQFPMRFRGFHTEEVSAFLEAIREEIEDLLRENAQLRECLQQADDESRRFWEMQDLLGRILQEAHQMSEEYKVHARREADQLLKAAAEQAEELVGRSHEQMLVLNEEIVELRMVQKRFHVEMKEVLGRFRRLLDDECEKRKEEFSLHSLHVTGGEGDLTEDSSEKSGVGSAPEE